MDEGSVATWDKPITHNSLPDWFAEQWKNQQTNETRRSDAFRLRHEARQLRNETKIRTDWDTYLNNVRLADRITELNRWCDSLTSSLERFDYEISSLREEKFSAERELDALGIPIGIVSECISMRDSRQGAELTDDEASTELKRELCILETLKKLLMERCQFVWQKITKLEEVLFKLRLGLNKKKEAAEMDKDQLTLDKNCANISYKIDPMRLVKNSKTYEAWSEDTHHLKQLADNELADTHKLREGLFVTRERGRNDVIAQRDRVDFILRKRIYETQKSRNELEWQQLKMREEMKKLICEVKTLYDALEAKTDALKLAETRLENRSYRPGKELVRDEPEVGLKNEVDELRRTRKRLNEKIDCTKATYNALENQQFVIDTDLENKSQSLMTDVRCLDLRIRLRKGEFAGPATDTDRNITLNRLEKEIPPT